MYMHMHMYMLYMDMDMLYMCMAMYGLSSRAAQHTESSRGFLYGTSVATRNEMGGGGHTN